MAISSTALERRVLLFDGAMGTQIQGRELSVEADFWGQENCSEVLNLSRPDLVREIHLGYLEAGADALETNSFGGSPVTLGEFDLGERAFEINRRAAELAREAIAQFAGDGRRRFVIGAIGPGTRLPSLGHIAYRHARAGVRGPGRRPDRGRRRGDPVRDLPGPAAGQGRGQRRPAARCARPACSLPLMVQVTVETTGTLLVGTDIAAAATIVGALDVPIIGLNCATGPQEMAEHLATLAESWPGPISVLPNAGLPELVEGQTRYPLGPRELAGWLERFVVEDGVGDHRRLLRHHGRAHPGARPDAAPARRGRLPAAAEAARGRARRRSSPRSTARCRCARSSAYLSIGERCNANGSKAFRERQAAGDWDGCVAIGRAQVKEGAHALDVCTAYVGRDESRRHDRGGQRACAARSTARWCSIRPSCRCSRRRSSSMAARRS